MAMEPDQLLEALIDGLDPRHEVQPFQGPYALRADTKVVKAVVYFRDATGKQLRCEVTDA